MKYGDGIVGIFIAFLNIIETFAIVLITGFAIIYFFWLIVKYIFALRGGGDTKGLKVQITYTIVLLTIMFTIYGLIALVADTFVPSNSGQSNIYYR